MELDKFISNTLKSIIKGINESKEYALENGARINPYIDQWDQGKTMHTYYGREDGARAISKVDFDIAVVASNTQETGGQGGINVYSLKLGGNLSDTEKTEKISRIKFELNVVFPNTEP